MKISITKLTKRNGHNLQLNLSDGEKIKFSAWSEDINNDGKYVWFQCLSKETEFVNKVDSSIAYADNLPARDSLKELCDEIIKLAENGDLAIWNTEEEKTIFEF